MRQKVTACVCPRGSNCAGAKILNALYTHVLFRPRLCVPVCLCLKIDLRMKLCLICKGSCLILVSRKLVFGHVLEGTLFESRTCYRSS
jgi:hypothetical protein